MIKDVFRENKIIFIIILLFIIFVIYAFGNDYFSAKLPIQSYNVTLLIVNPLPSNSENKMPSELTELFSLRKSTCSENAYYPNNLSKIYYLGPGYSEPLNSLSEVPEEEKESEIDALSQKSIYNLKNKNLNSGFFKSNSYNTHYKNELIKNYFNTNKSSITDTIIWHNPYSKKLNFCTPFGNPKQIYQTKEEVKKRIDFLLSASTQPNIIIIYNPPCEDELKPSPPPPPPPPDGGNGNGSVHPPPFIEPDKKTDQGTFIGSSEDNLSEKLTISLNNPIISWNKRIRCIVKIHCDDGTEMLYDKNYFGSEINVKEKLPNLQRRGYKIQVIPIMNDKFSNEFAFHKTKDGTLCK